MLLRLHFGGSKTVQASVINPMSTEYIAGLLVGFTLLTIGLRGTIQVFGLTADKQYGKKNLEEMITSLVMAVWGLAILVLVIVLHQLTS